MPEARHDRLALAYSALCLVACRLIALRVLPMYDDAFITLRYARNLALGHGFVYQVGERVLGTTTPLFGLLCALPFALRLPMPETVRAFNIACDVATLVVAWGLLRDAAPRPARLLFAAFFAAGPILNRVCVGGMEMDLYLLVSLCALRLELRGKRAGVGLAAVGYFLRPESALLVGLLVVRTWRRAGMRSALGSAALALLIVAPPLFVIHGYYGAALSQSVAAKWGMARPPLGDVLRPLLAYEAFVLALLPLTAWGAWRALRARGPLRVLVSWMLLQIAAYAAARPKIWSWYVEPIVFVAVLLAAFGAADLLARWPGARRARAVERVALAGAALALGLWVAIGVYQGPSAVTRGVFVPLAAWSRTHGGPGVTFMASDVGALGYDTDSRIYDQAGLVWPPGTRLAAEQIVQREAPDYLFLNATQDAVRLLAAPAVAGRYRPIARFSKAGETTLTLDPARAPTGWVQDYLLLERRDRPPATP